MLDVRDVSVDIEEAEDSISVVVVKTPIGRITLLGEVAIFGDVMDMAERTSRA